MKTKQKHILGCKGEEQPSVLHLKFLGNINIKLNIYSFSFGIFYHLGISPIFCLPTRNIPRGCSDFSRYLHMKKASRGFQIIDLTFQERSKYYIGTQKVTDFSCNGAFCITLQLFLISEYYYL